MSEEVGSFLWGMALMSIFALAFAVPLFCEPRTVEVAQIPVPNQKCANIDGFSGHTFILCKGDCTEYGSLKLCYEPKAEKP